MTSHSAKHHTLDENNLVHCTVHFDICHPTRLRHAHCQYPYNQLPLVSPQQPFAACIECSFQPLCPTDWTFDGLLSQTGWLAETLLAKGCRLSVSQHLSGDGAKGMQRCRDLDGAAMVAVSCHAVGQG